MPSSTETEPESGSPSRLAVTTSGLPSPFRSPIAKEKGWNPVG